MDQIQYMETFRHDLANIPANAFELRRGAAAGNIKAMTLFTPDALADASSSGCRSNLPTNQSVFFMIIMETMAFEKHFSISDRFFFKQQEATVCRLYSFMQII